VSITLERSVACACGADVSVTMCESLNAARHPALRDAVLARTLHTAVCARCGQAVMVAARFTYVDLERRQLIGVYLPDDRRQERACGEELITAYQRFFVDGPPLMQAIAGDLLVRVVFSYEELREKLVGDDAALPDLAVEAAKYDLLGDARLRAVSAATLRLDEVRGGALHLYAEDVDGRPQRLRVAVPRDVVDAMPPRDQLLAAYPGIASGPHVSLLRLLWCPAAAW
jgi:hypothetical protein